MEAAGGKWGVNFCHEERAPYGLGAGLTAAVVRVHRSGSIATVGATEFRAGLACVMDTAPVGEQQRQPGKELTLRVSSLATHAEILHRNFPIWWW